MQPPPPQLLDYASPNPKPTDRWQRVLLRACWLYPPVVLSAFVAMRLIHRADGLIWRLLEMVSMLLVITSPLLGWISLIVGLLLTLEWDDDDVRRVRTPILLVAWYLAFLFLAYWDPLGVWNIILD